MTKPIIEIKNLSKSYTINHNKEGGYVALRDILADFFKKTFTIKQKKTSNNNYQEEFWALKDINFSVKKGEAIGVIGANGAGKSTLLKILSEITPPTTGEIILRGKVASLLEVGTGFHPELTGRENILLNGAMLGMPKKETVKKFDRIVEFAGINKFLDTPVKRYSSGMYVRLAFSVAAHMEPDILIVDEVLAVGDSEFQKKCLGRMSDVIQSSGRTVIFVSHNLSSVQKLCSRSILLTKGNITMFGETEKVINHYQKNITNYLDCSSSSFAGYSPNNEYIEMIEFIALPSEESIDGIHREFINVKLKFKITKETNKLSFGVGCRSITGVSVFTVKDTDSLKSSRIYKENVVYEASFKIFHNLMPGFFTIGLGITNDRETIYYDEQQSIIEIPQSKSKNYLLNHSGVIYCDSSFSII